MTGVSDRLMLAILSLDSYDHGYKSGVGDLADGLGGIGSQIGNATIIARDGSTTALSVSFYAQAYSWTNSSGDAKIVISYRGTDDYNIDPITGWTVGAGFPNASQGQLAIQFYDSVKNWGRSNISDPALR